MIDYLQLLVLGAIAGLTIFLGLPLALLQGVSSRKKGFLNALSIGILMFLIIDVFGHAWQKAGDVAVAAFSGSGPSEGAVMDLTAFIVGLGLGLLGLAYYESRYMGKSQTVKSEDSTLLASQSRSIGGSSAQLQRSRMVRQFDPYRLAMMIATGIGAHNFSEGLAIGQSYVAGSTGLALLLVIGFGAHNATEGFGIAGPLTGLPKRPSARFLTIAGLIGGGPTFLGTIIGSLWTSDIAYILFLSIAGGALVYVSMLMYNAGRMQTSNGTLMLGIFFGLCAGFLTDLVVTLAGA